MSDLEVVSGPEGPALYFRGYRIAGPKPWGGGRVLHSFDLHPDVTIRTKGDPDHAKALAEALRRVAWFEDIEGRACAACDRFERFGHADDCVLARALAAYEADTREGETP